MPPDQDTRGLRRRLMAYRWTFFDAALAAGLSVYTLQEMSGEGDMTWWFVVLPMGAALLIRRRFPLLAVIVASGAALLHHLEPAVDIQAIDLAVPLTVYTLASTVSKRRRNAVFALVATLACVSLLSAAQIMTLAGQAQRHDKGIVDMSTLEQIEAAKKKQAAIDAMAEYQKPIFPDVQMPDFTADGRPTPSELVRDAVARALSILLIVALAFAIGDGVRSRRAHLMTLEKRADDLEREQRQRVALSLAAERARITRELHDVVAHALSVMVVQAQGGAAALRRHPDRTEVALQNVITTGRTSLAEMRRLLDLVRQDPSGKPRHAPQPGVDALPELIDGVRAAGTPVTFTVEGDPIPLPLTVDLSAYRIIQEALTNTIKHAGGTGVSAHVRVAYLPNGLELEVTDDGRGPGEEAGEGNGLRGIAERVAVLDGELSVGPADNRNGFRVHATLPLRPKGVE